MTTAIGQTFYQELKNAGVAGLAFSWGADGDIIFDPSLTTAQIATINAVYAAHDPSKVDNSDAARILLTESDTTLLRCAEAAVEVPEEWAIYRRALRAIVQGNLAQVLPTKPAYPAGT